MQIYRIANAYRDARQLISRNCHKETTNAHLTAAQEVKLVDAIVHALHVLEDIGPGVRRRAKGRQVAGLLQATKQVRRTGERRKKQNARRELVGYVQEAWGCQQSRGTGHR